MSTAGYKFERPLLFLGTCLKSVAKVAAVIAYLAVGVTVAFLALWGLAALVR